MTGELTTGVGENVKLVVSGGGVETVTDWELFAVWAGDAESVAVSFTVNVWAVA